MFLSIPLLPALLLPTPPPMALAAPPATGKDEVGVPGMVFIKGGRTYLGVDAKEIEKILEENEALRQFVRPLDAETPQFDERLSDYFLMVTEVTNEQYRAFVQATHHRPPFTWGKKAIDAAREAFLKAEYDKQQAAKARGESYTRKPFDPAQQERWWSQNWSEAEWEMPAEIALHPVTYVDHADALAYCRWAGLRLPTEYEFQRAVRGDKKRAFPWGDEWETGRAATVEAKRDATFKAGSFPTGATEDGIQDLIGNVWEWTDSPYVAHPKLKQNTYTFGRGSSKESLTPDTLARFDPNQRVAVGGCFQVPALVSRASVRRATDRTQMTNSLGFRCAATPAVGIDVATAIEVQDVHNSDARGEGVDFDPRQTVALDRWESRASEFEGAPEGYAVITDYDFLVFTPVDKLPYTSDVDVDNNSRIAPIRLGFLSLSETLLEPALGPGTYVLAYRAKGKAQVVEAAADEDAKDKDEAPVEEDPLLALIDTKKDNFLLFDALTNELVHHFEATPESMKGFQQKAQAGGSWRFEDKIVWVTVEGEQVQKSERWLTLDVGVQSAISNRPLKLEFQFKPAPEVGTKDWRK